MNDIELIMKLSAHQTYQENLEKGIILLRELIQKLESMSQNKIIEFDFCATPNEAHSYRGYYRDLAFSFAPGTEYYDHVIEPIPPKTVSQFLKECKEADGKTYTGWKGGDFTMSGTTQVWASQEGMSSGIAITDIKELDDKVVIITKSLDSYE